MTKRLRGDNDSAPAGPRGSLTAEGLWSRAFAFPTLTEKYVAELCRARRAARLSPELFAARIRDGHFPQAFPTAALGGWDQYTDWLLWPCVPTSSSAEAMVKYCGWSNSVHGHWRGGEWFTGDDDRPFVPVDQDEVSRFLPELVAKFPGLPAPALSLPQLGGRVHGSTCTCEACFAKPWRQFLRSVGEAEPTVPLE